MTFSVDPSGNDAYRPRVQLRMAAKLKAFCWSDGLHTYTVAATSRAKALAAWGFHRDLFKDGEAREITGGGDFDRAMARPGETIRRGLAGDVSRLPPPTAARRTPRRRPSKADLERIAHLETAITDLDRDRDRQADALNEARQALEVKEADLPARFAPKRRALERRLAAARAKLMQTD